MSIEKVIDVPQEREKMSKQKIAKIAALAVAGVVGIATFALAVRNSGGEDTVDSANNEK